MLAEALRFSAARPDKDISRKMEADVQSERVQFQTWRRWV